MSKAPTAKPLSVQPFSPWVGVAAMWLFAFTMAVLSALKGQIDGDEFIFVLDAARVADGQVQSRDFFQYITGGWLLVTGAVFKLFGVSLMAARLTEAAFLATLVAIYWRLGRLLGFAPILAFVVATVPVLVFNHVVLQMAHRWFGQTTMAFALLALFCAVKRPSLGNWFWVGLGVGLTHTMHQQDGAVAFLGIGLGALWLAWFEGWTWGLTWRRAAGFLAGWLLPLALFFGYYAWHGTLGQFLYDTHIWTVTQYRGPHNHNDVAFGTDFAPSLSFLPWLSQPYFWSKLIRVPLTGYIPVVATVAGMAWWLGLRRSQQPRPLFGFLGIVSLLCAVSLYFTLRERADLAHLAGALMPPLLLVGAATMAYESLLADVAAAGALRWLPRAVLVLFTLSGQVQAVERARKEPTFYRPRLESIDKRLAAHPTIARLRGYLKPGDTVLVGGHASIFNLYLAPNPTRFDYWLPPDQGFTTPAQFETIKADVLAKKPKLYLLTATKPERADMLVETSFPGLFTFVEKLEHPVDPTNEARHVYVYRWAEKGEPLRKAAE